MEDAREEGKEVNRRRVAGNKICFLYCLYHFVLIDLKVWYLSYNVTGLIKPRGAIQFCNRDANKTVIGKLKAINQGSWACIGERY